MAASQVPGDELEGGDPALPGSAQRALDAPVREDPVLRKDPQFRVFLDIFANPKSSTQPVLKIGAQNQTLFSTFISKWQAGHVPSKDLQKGLANVDKQIDDAIGQSGQVP